MTGNLPGDVKKRLGLNLRAGRNCGSFSDKQIGYLDYHRAHVCERRYTASADPVDELVENLLVAAP